MKYVSYIDPGTGSLFIQTILGTLLVGVVVFRNFFRRLFAKIKASPSRTTAKDEEA